MKRRLNWGAGIAVVYALFALATTAFAWYASRQRVELVSDDYYARSLDLDRRMTATANAEALDARFILDVSSDGRVIDITWPPEHVGIRGTLRLYRASDALADHIFVLTPDRDNHQRFVLQDLAAGYWSIQLDWVASANMYYVERKLSLQ